jgi:hypothetical protein
VARGPVSKRNSAHNNLGSSEKNGVNRATDVILFGDWTLIHREVQPVSELREQLANTKKVGCNAMYDEL